MACDVDLRKEIFNKTLQEVARDDEDGSPGPCVICLESITEPGIAVPCKHANFDFLCLASWLQQQRTCPLCKTEITAVKYDIHSPEGSKLYLLPSEPAGATQADRANPAFDQPGPAGDFRNVRRRPYYHRPNRRPPPSTTTDSHDPLIWRRHVYRHQLFSLRVGSNRLSRYRELTPQLFSSDEELVSRARKWIRRELQVFEFLNPDTPETSDGGETANSSNAVEGRGHMHRSRGEETLARRRANNAEFLLEYIIAILRTVDIKGSAGQAEELLREFIGRANARLFLHELQSWLRSPYTNLRDWDRHVQYEDRSRSAPTSPSHETLGSQTSRSASATQSPTSSPRGRAYSAGRVWKPYRSPQYGGNRSSSGEAQARARRIQYARERYQPD